MEVDEKVRKIKKRTKIIVAIIIILTILIEIWIIVMNRIEEPSQSSKPYVSYQEIDIYNAKVKSYLGDTVKGSEVKSMIDSIISMNQENVGKSGRFISLETYGISRGRLQAKFSEKGVNEVSNYINGDELSDLCANANLHDSGNNTQKNVDETVEEMLILTKKIDSQKYYNVVADYDENGRIIRVGIGEISE